MTHISPAYPKVKNLGYKIIPDMMASTNNVHIPKFKKSIKFDKNDDNNNNNNSNFITVSNTFEINIQE